LLLRCLLFSVPAVQVLAGTRRALLIAAFASLTDARYRHNAITKKPMPANASGI
jgi:hypothetical protein